MSRSLSTDGIREARALHEWQVEEINQALAEADRGEFATDEEVNQLLIRWARVRLK